MNLLANLQSLPELIRSRPARKLIHSIIISAVILISLVLALFGSERMMMLSFGLIGAVIGLLLLIQHPVLGIFFALVGGVSIPFTGPGGLNMAILGIAATIGLWLVDMVVRQKRLSLAPSRMNAPVVVFLICSVISFIIGQFRWYPSMPQAPFSAQAGGLAIFLFSGMAFLLVANLMKSPRWLGWLVGVFLCIGLLYFIGRLVPGASRLIRPFFQQGFTTGSLFWVWLTVIPYSQALLNHTLHKRVRAGLFAFVLLVMYVAVFDGGDWKSGYIPPIAGLGVITALWLRKKVWLFLPFVPVVVWYIITQAVETDVYSTSTRMDAWLIISKLSLTNPILGLGFANYYWYTPLMPIMGWYVNFNSHSQYIDIFAQTGIVGLLCVFWLFLSIGKLAWDLRERVAEGFSKAYVYGALGGLAGTIVAGFFVDWFFPFVYNIGMRGFRSSMLTWIFLGALVMFENIVNQQSQPAQLTSPNTEWRKI